MHWAHLFSSRFFWQEKNSHHITSNLNIKLQITTFFCVCNNRSWGDLIQSQKHHKHSHSHSQIQVWKSVEWYVRSPFQLCELLFFSPFSVFYIWRNWCSAVKNNLKVVEAVALRPKLSSIWKNFRFNFLQQRHIQQRFLRISFTHSRMSNTQYKVQTNDRIN